MLLAPKGSINGSSLLLNLVSHHQPGSCTQGIDSIYIALRVKSVSTKKMVIFYRRTGLGMLTL